MKADEEKEAAEQKVKDEQREADVGGLGHAGRLMVWPKPGHKDEDDAQQMMSKKKILILVQQFGTSLRV